MEPTQQTTEAANPTEGAATSTTAATEAATAAAAAGQTQQATEGQTTEATTTAEAGKTEGEQANPQGTPEAYEFKAPEGRQFDPKVLEGFSEAAKELNLPQEAAQAILDKIAPALAAKQEEALANVREQWQNDSKADKEFGGDKLTENLALAKKAIDTFGTPELRTLLDETGLGNHPELIRAFVRAGKAISEDGFVPGRSGNVAQADPAKRMFPNMN
jgi:hypothetical protein